MKNKVTSKSLIILLSILIGITQNSLAQDPNFFIFLCFGQSNMEGQGTISGQDNIVDGRFRVLQSVDCENLEREQGNWYKAVPPLTRCWNGLSPADYFGHTLVEALPEHIRIAVINVSVGGCKIELYDKDNYQNYVSSITEDWLLNIINEYDDGNPYGHLVSLAKKAQEFGVVKGILLHQGESNNGDANWPAKVKVVYDNLISDLSLTAENTPLLAGELVHEDQGGLLAGMNTIINMLPETIPNSHIISSSGCTAKSDKIHFDAEGYRELGRRYGEKMLSLLDYDEEAPLHTENLSHGYGLTQNFPNPVKNQTTFTFQVPFTSFVELILFDLSGKPVKQLMGKTITSGKHQCTYDLSDISKGTYIYQLKAGDIRIQEQLILE